MQWRSSSNVRSSQYQLPHDDRRLSVQHGRPAKGVSGRIAVSADWQHMERCEGTASPFPVPPLSLAPAVSPTVSVCTTTCHSRPILHSTQLVRFTDCCPCNNSLWPLPRIAIRLAAAPLLPYSPPPPQCPPHHQPSTIDIMQPHCHCHCHMLMPDVSLARTYCSGVTCNSPLPIVQSSRWRCRRTSRLYGCGNRAVAE